MTEQAEIVGAPTVTQTAPNCRSPPTRWRGVWRPAPPTSECSTAYSLLASRSSGSSSTSRPGWCTSTASSSPAPTGRRLLQRVSGSTRRSWRSGVRPWPRGTCSSRRRIMRPMHNAASTAMAPQAANPRLSKAAVTAIPLNQ